MDDLTFERQVLAPIAAATAYPDTPQFRARVLTAIAHEDRIPTGTAPPSAPRLRFVSIAAIVAMLSALAFALAVPGSRSAIADFFGVSGSKVEVLPTPQPGSTPTPFPTPADIQSYATPASLDAAREAAFFTPALPGSYGEPAGVYIVDYGEPPAIVLNYDQFDLWESRSTGFFQKGVPADLTIRDFTINGRPATLIRGGEHIVRYVDAEGHEAAASVRTVGRTTLIWNGERNFYRIESNLPEADMIAIAASLP